MISDHVPAATSIAKDLKQGSGHPTASAKPSFIGPNLGPVPIDYEPLKAPPLMTTSLTASLTLPNECIVLSSIVKEASPERKVQKLESASCFIRKDGRALHPKPFRTY
uniref:Uncharacterized protein n=1 Tax=Anopheles albimanus TaxID=7167 RepID=A0A182F7L4_ANOAL